MCMHITLHSAAIDRAGAINWLSVIIKVNCDQVNIKAKLKR